METFTKSKHQTPIKSYGRNKPHRFDKDISYSSRCDERALTESVIKERTQPWTSRSRVRVTSKARTLINDYFVSKTPWQHRPLYHQTNCQPTLGPHRIEAVPWHQSVGLKILTFVAKLILLGLLIRLNNVRENIVHPTLLHAQWMFTHQRYVRMDRPVQVSEPNHHFHDCLGST